MIPVSDDAQTITLPDNSDIIVFAITLSDNQNDDITPLSEVMSLPTYKDIQAEDALEECGEYLTPSVVKASGYKFGSEAPICAADRDPFTKWCAGSGAKWLEYDFGKKVEICQWLVVHAGMEEDSFITSDFSLQRYNEATDSYIDVEILTNNTDAKTNRYIKPFIAQKVRLKIDKGEQSNNSNCRIYAFELFGDSNPDLSSVFNEQCSASLLGNYPNPFSESTTITYNAPVNTNSILLNVYDASGKMIDSQKYSASGGLAELEWKNKDFPSGIYFYTVIALDGSIVLQQDKGKMVIAQ